MKKLALTFILLLTVGTLFTSCREKTTGEKIEDGIEEVGDGLEDAADDIEDEME
jgi:hypothetical protein